MKKTHQNPFLLLHFPVMKKTAVCWSTLDIKSKSILIAAVTWNTILIISGLLFRIQRPQKKEYNQAEVEKHQKEKDQAAT